MKKFQNSREFNEIITDVKNKKFSEALKKIKPASLNYPNENIILKLYAIIYFNLKEWNNAINYYKRCLNFEVEKYKLFTNIGVAYFKLGKINQSIIYYQPIYLQGEQNPLPEFKFVVVVFQDKIIMKETLSEAIESIFGETSNDSEEKEDQLKPLDLLIKASEAFDKAQDELLNGNLGAYQDLIERAQRLVQQAVDLLNNN